MKVKITPWACTCGRLMKLESYEIRRHEARNKSIIDTRWICDCGEKARHEKMWEDESEVTVVELSDLLRPPYRGVLSRLPLRLIEEVGMPPVGVAMSRGTGETIYHTGTVGEFLSLPENQGGSWYIDGGWGGPPGPVRVDWNAPDRTWINKGFPPHE